ncbi:hypothetical protein MKX01_013936, partial [Papaver californicum]
IIRQDMTEFVMITERVEGNGIVKHLILTILSVEVGLPKFSYVFFTYGVLGIVFYGFYIL